MGVYDGYKFPEMEKLKEEIGDHLKSIVHWEYLLDENEEKFE